VDIGLFLLDPRRRADAGRGRRSTALLAGVLADPVRGDILAERA
jgi:hypothetical protein